MPEPTTPLRRGVRVFRGSEAREMHDTPMMRKPQVDDAAREALPEFSAAGGTFGMVLFGDPEHPDDGGMSLVRTWFAPNFVLPRHSHSTDCLYYVVAGEVHLGSRTLSVGDGFFVGADSPYGYTAGPEGAEVLEFRTVSAFDSCVRETAAGWERILRTVRANRDDWAARPDARRANRSFV
jgi:quercetin dioxygenase-like cupin family protein